MQWKSLACLSFEKQAFKKCAGFPCSILFPTFTVNIPPYMFWSFNIFWYSPIYILWYFVICLYILWYTLIYCDILWHIQGICFDIVWHTTVKCYQRVKTSSNKFNNFCFFFQSLNLGEHSIHSSPTHLH